MVRSGDTTRISRFMALVLRHKPADHGIALDAEGWTSVASLLAAIRAAGFSADQDTIEAIVLSDGKGRYALSGSGEGQRIRANQGHSVALNLTFEPATPPRVLYHGTVQPAVEAIFREGLRRMQRHHVHLSPDVETATKVGARRGKPVVLAVDAAAMAADGYTFFRSENGVWLTDTVPPRYLSRYVAPDRGTVA